MKKFNLSNLTAEQLEFKQMEFLRGGQNTCQGSKAGCSSTNANLMTTKLIQLTVKNNPPKPPVIKPDTIIVNQPDTIIVSPQDSIQGTK